VGDNEIAHGSAFSFEQQQQGWWVCCTRKRKSEEWLLAETDKGLEKAIDDHLKRLQERYKANIKVFNATHIGHISLAIVFLISILFPFLYLQVDTRKVNLEMAGLSQKIERQQQRVATYNRAVSGLKRVFEAVENTPKPLEGYIGALEKEADGGPKAQLPRGLQAVPAACGAPESLDPWMACRIRQYVASRFMQSRDYLQREVAAPLQELDLKQFDQWIGDLQKGVQDLADQFESRISVDPGFWRNFDRNSPLYQRMIEDANRFWTEHQFEEIGDQMAQEIDSMQAAEEELNQKKEQIQKRREDLNSAFKNIKIRFGKFGLEPSDAILIVPIVLAALFLVAVMNLSESIRLRKSFQRLFQARDPRKVAITDSQITLAMPLWVDPLDPRPKRRLRLAALAIPAVVSVLTLLVVFYCWTIPDAFPGLSGADYWKYVFYYILSAGLFSYGFRRLHSAVKNYSENMPAAEPVSTT
jgi:cell division protein FtsL